MYVTGIPTYTGGNLHSMWIVTEGGWKTLDGWLWVVAHSLQTAAMSLGSLSCIATSYNIEDEYHEDEEGEDQVFVDDGDDGESDTVGGLHDIGLYTVNYFTDKYSHFVWFLYTEMLQVVQILPDVSQGSTSPTVSIAWLLMARQCKEPVHQ